MAQLTVKSEIRTSERCCRCPGVAGLASLAELVNNLQLCVHFHRTYNIKFIHMNDHVSRFILSMWNKQMDKR